MNEEKRFVLCKKGDKEYIEDNGCVQLYGFDVLCEMLNELNDKNEWLKQQLFYDGDDVCSICKHEYLVPYGDYFIGKCEKGHEECSKEDIKYCEDFELIQAGFEDLIKRMGEW